MRQHNPNHLLYLYPKIPAYRFKQLSDAWYKNRTMQAAAQVAAMFDAVLVPAPCFNPKRRRPDRRLSINGRTFYVMSLDDMTAMELAKYATYAGDAGVGVTH